MKYLLWLLLLFAAAVAIVISSHNPGYVLFVYPPYRIELSLTLFLILVVLGSVLAYLLGRLIVVALQLPEYVRRFRMERTQARAQKLLDEALNLFFEGRYAAAEQASRRAIETGEASALHPIIAARAAHELGEFEKRDAYLAASEGKSVGESTMRLMAQSKFMLDQRDPRAALHALQELRASGVKGHVGALSLELKAQQQAGNWDAVLALLDQLEHRHAIDVTVAAQLRQQSWLEKLRQQEGLDSIQACLKVMPPELKRRSKVTALAARKLIQHSGCEAAQQLLTDSLNAQWDSELVTIYGDCHSTAGNNQGMLVRIEQAEKWLNQHRDDAGLLLALGKLCLHQQLWGKSQSYLDASLSIAPSRDGYTALGQLAEKLGKPDESVRYFHRAMGLAQPHN
jgi:HemY protein